MLKHRNIVFLCSSLFILLYLLNANAYFFWLLFLFWLGLTTWGVFDIRLGYFVKTYSSLATKEKKIAITFDDGPHEMTPKILDVLQKYNCKASFFCIGNQVDSFPEVLKRIASEEHIIGNHSNSHSNFFGFFSTGKVLQELNLTNQKIEKLIGKKVTLFRPPFGVTNPSIAKASKQLNFNVIGWNIRSLDTIIDSDSKLFERVKKKVRPGGIILFHDTSEKTVIVLERLLLFLQSENYQVVTVDKLLNLQAYEA